MDVIRLSQSESLMPRFTPIIDLPVLMFAFIATLAGTLYWVFQTEQDGVPKTGDAASRAAFRLSIVAGLMGVFCYLTGIAFWFVLIITAFLMLGVLAGDMLGIAGLPLVALGYLVKEYVLGFPELILSPKLGDTNVGQTQEFHEMVGRNAITTAPLRPQGDIVIDGQFFPASSDSGTLIDPGVAVFVVGSRNGNLLVAESRNDG